MLVYRRLCLYVRVYDRMSVEGRLENGSTKVVRSCNASISEEVVMKN